MKLAVIISLALILLLPASASAHLSGEAVLDNNYRIELGHLPKENLQPGENISFIASLEDLEGEGILKIRGWIRVSLGDLIMFSSTDFQTEDGTIDFSTAFEKAGEYDITVRLVDLEKGEEATGVFPIIIGDPEHPIPIEEIKEERKSNFNLATLTLIFGVITGILLARYRPLKNGKN